MSTQTEGWKVDESLPAGWKVKNQDKSLPDGWKSDNTKDM